MRGYAFLLVYLYSLRLIFKSPFNGVLVWYAFSFGNFHTLIWDAYVIAILAILDFGGAVYALAPQSWFNRMGTIEPTRTIPRPPGGSMFGGLACGSPS